MLKLDESSNFADDFIKFVYKKSQLLCNPILNVCKEDGFNQCKSSLAEFDNYVLGSESLKKSSDSNSICGKIFKAQEQTYICRDCATDTTCRFCRECFIKSDHIKHNYQLFTSNGGGCCDCGDSEAWKMFPRCSTHGVNGNVSKGSYSTFEEINGQIRMLPEGVMLRFLTLTKAIFDNFKFYILRPLCKENDHLRREELGRELLIVRTLCPPTEIPEYVLVIYNNEIHNFDQVINLLKRYLSCTGEEAMEYANMVDRDGRCTISATTVRKDIETKQQEILTKSKTQTKYEFLCRVHHPTILAIQNFLLHSLQWLLDFVDEYPPLRLLLCQYLFYDVRISDKYSFDKATFVHDIFEKHIDLWKMARSCSSNFIMTVVNKEPFFKRLFAVEFVKNYSLLIEHYSMDDHNTQDSLVSLGCQIFTVKSLAKYLLDNNNVLSCLVKIAYETLLKHSKPLVFDGTIYPEIPVFHKDESDLHKKFDSYERHLKSICDIRFLLKSLGTCFIGIEGEPYNECEASKIQEWSEKSVANFLEYFHIFSKILSLIQETNTIERVVGHHIDHDPQWRTGIILMYDLVPCITLTSNLIISNPIGLNATFDMFRNVVFDRLIQFESKKRSLFEYLTYTAYVIDNESPTKYVSVIKPLHRFMANLLQQHSNIKELTTIEVDCLFDQALQLIVFASQQTGNMWIRNGTVPYILTQQMKCLTLSSEMFDRDLELVQQLALCMSPEEFIVKCIHKFDLKFVLTNPFLMWSDIKPLLQRVEDFVHLLIMTLFFRHRPQVGHGITQEKYYENYILHVLCIKPMAHSKLMKKLPLCMEKYPKVKLMKIIDNVADQTELSQIVVFHAKKSLIVNHFDRFSPYYSVQDRNEAEIYVQSIFKKEFGSNALRPPNPIELTDQFHDLYRYLSEPCLLVVLDKILAFCLDLQTCDYSFDTLIDMVVYFIGACLLEDIKILDSVVPERKGCLFIETALRSDLNIKIIEHLKSLPDMLTSPDQLQLIKWTVNKWYYVKKRLFPNLVPDSEESEVFKIDSEFPEMETEYSNFIDQSQVAKSRRELLLNRMKSMQTKFLAKHSDIVITTMDQDDQCQNEDLTCLLCQEKYSENFDRPIVAMAGAWRSTVLARHPITNQTLPFHDRDEGIVSPVPENSLEEISGSSLFRESLSYNEHGSGNDIDRVVIRSILPMLDHPEETFITTCGHVMHYDCKTRYVADIVKQKQNMARTKGILFPRIFNRCPLCKSVSNLDIPIIRHKTDDSTLSNDRHMSFNEWTSFFANWTTTQNVTLGNKKVNKPMHWWNKLSSQLSNIMKMTIPFKRNDSQASDEELLSCLGFRVGLAILLQPKKLTKETYNKYESISNSISESSVQDLIELDYAVSYTISVWEQLLNKTNGSLLTDLPERHATGLSYLIKAAMQSHELLSLKNNWNHDYHHFMKVLQQLLFNCTQPNLHKLWQELHKSKTPIFILEVDFTYIMTSLLFMRPNFCPIVDSNSFVKRQDETLASFLHKSDYNKNVIGLIFQFMSVQALLSLKYPKGEDVELIFGQLQSHSPDFWNEETVYKLYRLRLELSGLLPSLSCPSLNISETVVAFTKAVLPYLRCAAFILMSIGALKPPNNFANGGIEFNYLMHVLDLTIISDMVHDLPLYIKSHLQLIKDIQGNEIQSIWGTNLPHSLPYVAPRLIDLPLDFTEVISLCLERGCCLRQQKLVTVTELSLCLICGDTFCMNGYCCRRSEDDSVSVISGAQIHSRQRHGGYSLFLKTRSTKVIVMFYQARWQITLDPIYVDRYGETDIDLTKGNPLFLKVDSYRRLERRWLDHSLGSIINDGQYFNDFFV